MLCTDGGPAEDNWGEREDRRERSGYLSNSRSHVAPFTHSHLCQVHCKLMLSSGSMRLMPCLAV